ncbi:hypothetical protein H0H93_010092 [Arthromyces matolae]|nr:hypothetical protein H0H93_010092 [Arthromyces matolae]
MNKIKNVYIVGPSVSAVSDKLLSSLQRDTKSTGKTTLVDALVLKLGLGSSGVVKEVARRVMTTQGFSREDVGSMAMQRAILVAQSEREQDLQDQDCTVRICDRSAVDPIVYAVLTSPNDEEACKRRNTLVETREFQAVLDTYRRSTILLLAPVREWLFDDGIRLIEHQEMCFEIFKKVLQGLDIKFQIIGSDMRSREERVSKVLGLLQV